MVSPDKGAVQQQLLDKSGKILGKTYFRDPDVNKGFYSKKREGVADVDPKVSKFKIFILPFLLMQVMEPFVPIPGKPPRQVVIDRQRKLFASLNIEDLLLELVSTNKFKLYSYLGNRL